VKFVLGINVDVEDKEAQKTVDLAPENNSYDVYSVFLESFGT